MLVSIEPAPTITPNVGSMHRLDHLPILVLDLHSRCQCKCVMCDIWQRKTSHEMSYDMLYRNRDGFRRMGVKWVVLTGGEPLMHSRFADICAFFRAEGMRLTVLTAGMSLAKHARMVAYGVDDVIVSLDGPKAVHDHIRGIPGAYDLLVSGILNLLALRPEMQIRARTTVQKANHAHLRETVGTAQELDLSGISFLAADLASTAFNRDEAWPLSHQASVGLEHQEVEALESELEKLIAEFDRAIVSGYIAETPDKLRRIAQHFRARTENRSPHAPLCNAPWVSAVVEYDGSVKPCFFHPSIASLNNQTIDVALNNFSALQFRAGLNVAENPICQNCVCSLYRPQEQRQ